MSNKEVKMGDCRTCKWREGPIEDGTTICTNPALFSGDELEVYVGACDAWEAEKRNVSTGFRAETKDNSLNEKEMRTIAMKMLRLVTKAMTDEHYLEAARFARILAWMDSLINASEHGLTEEFMYAKDNARTFRHDIARPFIRENDEIENEIMLYGNRFLRAMIDENAREVRRYKWDGKRSD